jgi:hypothetical protein
VSDFDLIDPRFIDANFPAFDEYVPGDLRPENMQELCASMPAYEDVFGVIPTNEWVEIAAETDRTNTGIEWLLTRVFNQANEGSCVANAAVQMLQVVMAKQFGKDDVTQCSPISVYQEIGRSPNSGSMVSDALAYIRDVGALPLDTPENRKKYGDCVMPHTGFYTKKPANWRPVAKTLRFDEYYVIRSYEGLVSAGLRGDAEVVGREGHSILYLRPRFKTKSVNSLFYPYVNSWRESWGFAMAGFKGGFGADTVNQVRKSAGWAFSARSCVVN